MSDRIRLEVSCPDCGHSMMDEDHLIEGVPAVQCRIQVPGPNPKLPRKVPIWFSSYYGSGVYECEQTLEENQQMILFCPSCDTRLHGDFSCNKCGDEMVCLDLKGGGKITVCTRRGCKRHFIQLDENVPNLDRLFEIPAREKDGPVPSPLFAREVQATVSGKDDREIIASGSFLASYCPHCQESLIEDDHIVFELETQAGNTGRFCLSAYLNVFSHRSTVAVPNAEEIKDLRCPKCRHSLLTPEQKCGDCDSRTAMFTVSAMRKLISFYICLKEGCHWHGISSSDTQLLALEDSLEW
ncbi:MAG: hypothetical protein ABFS42_14795 [Candidatus Krumholzibacteriota bacterium]